jgi:DNA-binding transcriptional LysR family regulator
MAGRRELDWDDLRFFLRAAQAKTLAGAARALGVEHSTVGRRLTGAERALGAPLVLRGPDGLQLTPLGTRIVPLVEEVEAATRQICAVAAAGARHVRVATPSGFAGLLSSSLDLLREEHPDISLELISGARPIDLRKGEADLAIRAGPIADADLIARKLCDSGFSLYASEAYLARRGPPADAGDLTGHEVVGFDPTLAATPPARWIEAHAAGATMVFRGREMTDVMGAAVAGAGLAVLPCLLGDDEPKLRRVTERVLVRQPLSVVYRREARVAEPVRAVVRFVTAIMRRNAARIGGEAASRAP